MADLAIKNTSPSAQALPAVGSLFDACSLESVAASLQHHMDASSFFLSEVDIDDAARSAGVPNSQSSTDLLAQLDAEQDSIISDNGILGTSASGKLTGFPWTGFPSIPEHSELMLPSAVPILNPTHSKQAFKPSPVSSVDPIDVLRSCGTTPAHSGSSAAGAEECSDSRYGFSVGMRQMSVPRVSSMPNLHLASMMPSQPAGPQEPQVRMVSTDTLIDSSRSSFRRLAEGNRATTSCNPNIPRSRSASELLDLNRYDVPHAEFLTPPHLRKGKGGRQPAADPRLDPRIDPRKAKRILANRLSAAKSKLKQKSAAQGLRQRIEMLRLQKEGLEEEATRLEEACKDQEIEQCALHKQIRAIELHLSTVQGSTLMHGGTGFGMTC